MLSNCQKITTNTTYFSDFTFNIIKYMKVLSLVRLFATPWTVAYQAPLSTLSMDFQARVLEWVAISFFRESSP